MPESVKSNIFEPFFTTKEQGKGTGLGLATVYGIVKQSEGYIECSSALGEGTQFDVYLPAAPPRANGSCAEDAGEHVALNDETILLVEDDAVRDSAKEMLASLGFRAKAVQVAQNCKEGRRSVESSRAVDSDRVIDCYVISMESAERQ